nr:MAG TPA: hypothetical protein [Caudoviricetes sp.]
MSIELELAHYGVKGIRSAARMAAEYERKKGR